MSRPSPLDFDPRHPQAAQMADPAMLRTLRYQAEATWPQESRLLARYALPAGARLLDLGCGSGEFVRRLAGAFPGAESITGLDVLPAMLRAAEALCGAAADGGAAGAIGAAPGPRLSFEEGDATGLRFPDGHFDFVALRHLTQLLPDPAAVLAECRRVLRPGGWLHVVSEDYGMLHFPVRDGVDPDRLWHLDVVAHTRHTGTDARIGRRTLPLLRALGFEHVSIQYLVLDTERVPREVLAGIIESWRDGYAAVLAQSSGTPLPEVRALFDAALATLHDPQGYAVWQLPVVAGRKPADGAGAGA
ncbi:MAG: class I SAM-dependent methyltransferase [Planctomycetota bacterium]